MRRNLLGFALVGTAAVASTARAQNAPTVATGFSVNRYEPAERGSDWFALDSLSMRGQLHPAAGATFDFSRRPLAIYDDQGDPSSSVVLYRFDAHVGAAVSFLERYRVGLSMPIVLFTEGNEGVVGTTRWRSPWNAQTVGDLRVAADARVLGDPEGPWRLGAGVRMWLPTGETYSYTSDGEWRLSPHVSFAGDAGLFAYAAQVAYVYRARKDEFDGASIGNELGFAGSGGVRLLDKKLLVGPEVYGSTRLVDSGTAFFGSRTTPIEALAGAHYTHGDFRLGAALGPGFGRSYGSPQYRALLSIEWVPAERKAAPPPPPPPPPPPDTDGDGIVDPEDACADRAGPKSADPAKNGCPIAEIKNEQIEILEQVRFELNSATIASGESGDGVLQAVLKILNEHPDIRVRVEGHTDTGGADSLNRALGAKRAESVAKWLIAHGIAAERITHEGHGPDRPIASNDTEEGRRKNRRVEFHIVQGGTGKP